MKDRVIENYQREEGMMILLFAQWCINHEVNPIDVYERAYPQQKENEALKKALENTVSKEDSSEIPTEALMEILSTFGNEELAFIISEILEKK